MRYMYILGIELITFTFFTKNQIQNMYVIFYSNKNTRTNICYQIQNKIKYEYSYGTIELGIVSYLIWEY